MTEPRQPDVLSRLPIPDEVRDDVMEMLRVGPSAVWGRPVLSRRERSLATIAMMTALGNEFAIREHVIMGLGLLRPEPRGNLRGHDPSRHLRRLPGRHEGLRDRH